MNDPIQDVLAALRAKGKRVVRSGNGYTAQCPAHDDRDPSLSIDVGDDGRALLHCHAGCASADVVRALGMEERDLFVRDDHPVAPTRKLETERKPVKTYPTADAALAAYNLGTRDVTHQYEDADARVVGVIGRWERDDGKQIRPVSLIDGAWRLEAMPSPRPLYRVSQLADSDTIVVVEGEKCADVAVRIGYAGTTSAGGSHGAHKTDWSIAKGKRVIVLPDRDDAGEAYAKAVVALAQSAGATDVCIVRLWEHEAWAGLKEGGDLDDVLLMEHDDTMIVKDRLDMLIEQAEPIERPKLEAIAGAPVLRRMSEVEAKPVEWLWKHRIPMGRLTLFSGRPGCGKSFLTLDAAARVSNGTPWPDGSPCLQGTALLLSAEDNDADTIKPRLEACGADASKVISMAGVYLSSQDGKDRHALFTLNNISTLEQALQTEPDIKLIVIDPIGSYLGEKTDAYRDNEVRAVLDPLAKLAERYNVAVVIVAHNRKGVADFADDTTLGSRAFVGIARSVLHVMHDPQDEEHERRLLLPGKNNLSQEPPGLAYTIRGSPARVAWEPGTVNIRADEAMRMASSTPRESPALDEAIEFLEAELANGPRKVQEIKATAKQAGHSESAIRRARERLAIKPHKGSGKDAPWLLTLPGWNSHEQVDHQTPNTSEMDDISALPQSGEDAYVAHLVHVGKGREHVA